MAVTHTFLTKDNKQKTKTLTGMKAIREKCLQCSNWEYKEVELCPATDCALFPFRFGKSPELQSGIDPETFIKR